MIRISSNVCSILRRFSDQCDGLINLSVVRRVRKREESDYHLCHVRVSVRMEQLVSYERILKKFDI